MNDLGEAHVFMQIDIYELPSESRAANIPADRHMTTGKLQVLY